MTKYRNYYKQKDKTCRYCDQLLKTVVKGVLNKNKNLQ